MFIRRCIIPFNWLIFLCALTHITRTDSDRNVMFATIFWLKKKPWKRDQTRCVCKRLRFVSSWICHQNQLWLNCCSNIWVQTKHKCLCVCVCAEWNDFTSFAFEMFLVSVDYRNHFQSFVCGHPNGMWPRGLSSNVITSAMFTGITNDEINVQTNKPTTI